MDPILVVDDEPAVRALYRRTLERKGFSVLDARDGQEALDLIARRAVSLVLLDNQMPRMDGLAVVRALRADPASATLPVLLVTGRTDARDRIAGLEAGANDYLTKPVDLEELVARVHAQLRGQAAWSNRVVDMIEHRARLAVRINEIPTSNSPSAVGAAVCRVLATEPSINRAWIVRFPTGDLGAVLADSYLEPGDPRLEATIGTTFTREVRRRAESSAAWVHDEPLPGALGDRSTADASTVVAPLYRGPEHVDGAMVIQFTRPTGGPDRLNALATAIDLSPVVAAILHPSIEASEEHDATVIDLRESIGSGTFVPVSQPIVRLRDGEPVGFEALTRFEDGTRADLRFREAALLGVGAELELATMSAALDAGRGLPAEAWLSINVSSGLLHDRRIDPLLASAPRPVVLEITEHEEVQDYHAVRSAVRRMRPQPRIAVDDAGSGYASLQHILRLRPAFVKLDRAWVTGIELDPARQALIAGLHHFASQIGAELIGEGVERREECDTLAELGVTYAQGFLLGEPAPVGEPQTASRWVG